MSVSKFYQLELEKLLNEFEKISLFTKHAPTIGTYREQVLKKYLRYFTPNNLTISSGFVFDFIDAKPDELYSAQTKQVDCLIFDENNFTPFLKTEDFTIIEPESLYAGIEIKSQLTLYKEYDRKSKIESEEYPLKYSSPNPYRWAGTLIDALENIKSIANVTEKYNRSFFKGIFAYSSSVNWSNFLFAFDNGELQRQLNIKHLNQLPTYICIPSSHLIYINRVSLKWDESDGFDPSQSEMTIIESVEDNKGFPIQFFTNALKIHVEHTLTGKKPHEKGLFTAGLGAIKIWGHHFDLNSE